MSSGYVKKFDIKDFLYICPMIKRTGTIFTVSEYADIDTLVEKALDEEYSKGIKAPIGGRRTYLFVTTKEIADAVIKDIKEKITTGRWSADLIPDEEPSYYAEFRYYNGIRVLFSLA